MANELHDKVLAFAETYRVQHPDFYYALRKANRKNRLSDGLWFQGTENYAFVGLINRSGGTNMTKSLGLVFRPNGDDVKCNLEVVYNEETDRKILSFYSKLRDLIGNLEKIKDTKYEKLIAPVNGFAAASEFLNTMLPKIYALIKEMKLQSIMITREDFEESHSRIQEYKSDAANNPNYWIFQGNPKFFDFESAVRSDSIESWNVSAHRERIKPGDKVIVWLTGPKAGCYALAEVISEPFERKLSTDDKYFKGGVIGELQAGIKITNNLIDKPIFYTEIKDLPAFKNLKAGSQGTNFTATQVEYQTLLKIAVRESNQIRKYWLIAPGEQAMMWNEFHNKGIMAIGWHIGDIKQYTKQEEVEKELEKNSKVEKDQRINAQQCYEFGHDITLNDIIIAKKGMSEYLGWGIVTEEYTFHPDKSDYQHEVKVDWQTNGSWNGEIQLRKTVTNITNNPKLASVIELMDININGLENGFLSRVKNYNPEKFHIYINILREILNHFKLTYDSKKISFSIRPKRLNFIVGQRYCLILENKKGETVFGFISSRVLPTYDDEFDGPSKAYFNYTSDSVELKSYKTDLESGIESELNRTKYSGHLDANDNEFRAYVFNQPLEKPNIVPMNKGLSLNTILFGPPGTGKTFNTIAHAVALIENKDLNALKTEKRGDVKIRFEQYSTLGRIVFTTFHQSMSYEDFIEGIKPLVPEKEGDPVIYRVESGILKNISLDAAFSIAESRETETTGEVLGFSMQYDAFLEDIEEKLLSGEPVKLKTKSGGSVDVESISSQGNIIIKHHDGTRSYTVSKTRLTKLQSAITNLDEVTNINDQFRSIIGGSNSSAYWSVLNAIRNSTPAKIKKQQDDRIYTSEEKEEVVQSLSNTDYKNYDGLPYVLIIDEINRGNIAQIFGELITLIEEDKRLGKDEALEVTLPYSKLKFGVPKNLYIIGTMNTADRSVEALDAALRRRFSFEEIPPRYDLSQLKTEVAGYPLSSILERINMRLEKLLDKDHKIGHSYLMFDTNVNITNALKDSFYKNIIPLLQEYFFGDYGKIGLVLGKGFISTTDEKDALFCDFEYEGKEMLLEKPVYSITDYRQSHTHESDRTFEDAIALLMESKS